MEDKNQPRACFDIVVKRLSGQGPPAHEIWLPPLDLPASLDQMLPNLRPTPDLGLTTAGWDGRGQLHAAVGIVDRPFDQRRDPMWLDVSGAAGHVGVVGSPQSGKSTLLRTLVGSLALMHTPAEIQFYCLDFGGGTLAALDKLPHVGGVATRLDGDRVRRTVAEVATLLEERERYFAERGIDGMATYRRMRASGQIPGDGFGDVFLVVDSWLIVRQDFEQIESDRSPTWPPAGSGTASTSWPRPTSGRSSVWRSATCSGHGWSCGSATRTSRSSTGRWRPTCRRDVQAAASRARGCTSWPRCRASTAGPASRT